MDNPTLEDLQKQILELQKKNEELTTENKANSEKIEATNKDLENARKINAELWLKQKGGSDNSQEKENESEELTPEKALDGLLDDALNPNLDMMKKVYGDRVNTTIVKE